MKKIVLLFLLIAISCKPAKKELNAQEIIDKTIVSSGADKVKNSKIGFKFRDVDYAAVRKNGNFELFRFTNNSDNKTVEDVLSNNGFKRFVDGKLVKTNDSIANVIANAVNSVHYFSVLPFGLNDKAVHKKLLASSKIKGKDYHKIEVTFSKDGGGEDFEDVFIYWIGKEDFLIDYLAYSYHTNGGGKRFRALKKESIKNGIRFVDFENYKPLHKEISLIDIDKAFEKNELKKVSEIILENIEVKLLK
ncbi:DUF6503 family protein [Polaribacter sp.]|uniref:DUF6503 family protein n=1 Tax=Polaribacter sp. TaxID=1920175 RepID=UPI0035C79813